MILKGTMQSPGRDHALDGIRGIAAFAVVVSHLAAMSWNPFADKVAPAAWQYALWHLGAPAVDVFFVLSGYVVTGSLIRRGPLRGVPRYWAARAIRLLPIAWLGVIAGFAARQIALAAPAGASAALALRSVPVPAGDALAYLTMLVLPSDTTIVNPVLWTTFVEVNASLVLPLIAWAALRMREMVVPLVGAMLFAVATVTGSVFYLLLTPFALGAAIAVRDPRVPMPGALVLGLLSLVLLLSRHAIGEQDHLYRLVTMFGAAGLIVAVRSGAWRRTLETRTAAWLGTVSYPLYAIHYPVMMACVLFGGGSAIGVTGAAALSIPLSLVAAWLIAVTVDGALVGTASRIHHAGRTRTMPA